MSTHSHTQATMNNRIIRDADSIYDDMEDVDRDVFDRALEELLDVGYIIKELNEDDDQAFLGARLGLAWSEVVTIDCPIKKQILLCLIDNPHTFFVLYNTQKGKLRIAADEIHSWASVTEKKVVAFLIVDNDKTLADQTADGVLGIIERVADIYLLSSNVSTTTRDIKHAIDSYVLRGGKMPVVVALNNIKQIQKTVEIMKHVQDTMKSGMCPQLRYGVVFDEADKIYPTCRSSFESLLVKDESALHRLGFVTATEGTLMDKEYPECANAYMYPVPPGNPNYRAIHTEDAVINRVAHRVKDNNDVYAENILRDHAAYFKQTINMKNGTEGFRKVIVNSAAKTGGMKTFARNRNNDDAYAITVNMMGVRVYRPGLPEKRYSVKGVRLSQLLFDVYVELGLHDKPLYVIGRRKVDRGLGFHHAPRDGGDGLIFTDMILGRVSDRATAVQKAGRLAGVVAQCPQYPGKLTWWTDEHTALLVTRHNNMVDDVNGRQGCSALQAIVRAKNAVPEPVAAPKYMLSKRTFDTVQEAKDWWKDPASAITEPHDIKFSITQYRIYERADGTKYIKYRAVERDIISEAEARGTRSDVGLGTMKNARIMPVTIGDDLGLGTMMSARVMSVVVQDIQSGIASSARIMPVESVPNCIKYIVVYKPDATSPA